MVLRHAHAPTDARTHAHTLNPKRPRYMQHGQEDGIGVFRFADGATYEGFWKGGRKVGIGVFYPAPPPSGRAQGGGGRRKREQRMSQGGGVKSDSEGEAAGGPGPAAANAAADAAADAVGNGTAAGMGAAAAAAAAEPGLNGEARGGMEGLGTTGSFTAASGRAAPVLTPPVTGVAVSAGDVVRPAAAGDGAMQNHDAAEGGCENGITRGSAASGGGAGVQAQWQQGERGNLRERQQQLLASQQQQAQKMMIREYDDNGKLVKQSTLDPADVAAIFNVGQEDGGGYGSGGGEHGGAGAGGAGAAAQRRRASLTGQRRTGSLVLRQPPRQVTRLGEVIFKEHRCYDLMINLQLGIRCAGCRGEGLGF